MDSTLVVAGQHWLCYTDNVLINAGQRSEMHGLQGEHSEGGVQQGMFWPISVTL